MNKLVILIVTYNRLDKLKKCLESYTEQTVLPQKILVVDNASTDGTVDFLHRWQCETAEFKKDVVYLHSNSGGSGGFYSGMKKLRGTDFDWLWISDDDAYPESNAIEVLKKSIECNNEYDVFCSSVVTEEGIDTGHRKVICSKKEPFGNAVDIDCYKKECFDINIFSFVGSVISKRVLEECGLPEKDFFIWFDDTEYSLRVNQKFKMMCVPSIKVFHDTIIEKEWRYSWKTYFGERNKLYALKKHLTKNEYRKYEIHYIAGMIKHYFTDHKFYLSQIEGFRDYKKGVLGITEEHAPGKYKHGDK